MAKTVQVQLKTDGDWIETEVANFYDPTRHHTVRLPGETKKSKYAAIKMPDGKIYDKALGKWRGKERPSETYKLHLGCGNNKIPGYVNIDINEKLADLPLDLEEAELPFKDESVTEVVANHVMEHLRNFPALMNEIHRVLVPGGDVKIAVPAYPYKEAFQDPTHVRYFTDRTFHYFYDKDSLWQDVGQGYGFKPFSKLVQRMEGFQLIVHLKK